MAKKLRLAVRPVPQSARSVLSCPGREHGRDRPVPHQILYLRCRQRLAKDLPLPHLDPVLRQPPPCNVTPTAPPLEIQHGGFGGRAHSYPFAPSTGSPAS